MKIYEALSVLIILALGFSTVGQVSSQNYASHPNYGKAFLVQTVDVRDSPQFGFASPREIAQTQLGSGPQTLSATSSPSSPISAGNPLTFSTQSNQSVANFSFGFNGLDSNQGGGWSPSDAQVAIGQNYLVEMVNILGAIYTRQGVLVQTINLYQLFNAPYLGDPKVLYDNSSQRWFASMISGSSSFSQYPPANVTVAVSNNTDPFVWKVYNICAGQGGVCPTTYFPDQPILGVSDDKVAISVNDYANGGASIGAQYWILNKSEMLSGAQTINEYSHGPDSRFFSIHPVQSLSSSTTQFMVSTSSCCASNVTLFSVTGVPPNFVANSTVVLPISTMTIPPNGFQPETPSRVDSGRRWSPTICRDPPCVPPPSVSISGSGNRILSAVWFEGILWYTANDGCVPPGDSRQRSCVRLTQIDTGTATVTQDFDYAANGTYYFYPAVSIDKNGDLDMVFGFSSNTTYPSLAITGQARGDMSGALAPAITVKTGTAAATGGRYGDYFGAGIDPANPTTIWVAGQYGNSTDGTWATFIASMNVIRVGGPSDFSMSTICDYISPSTCGSSVITMASINGFAGTVSLSATASPSSGITPSLTPTSVSIPAGGNANSTLTVSTSCHSKTYCLWHVNVTGTSDALSHNISILVCAGRGCPQ